MGVTASPCWTHIRVMRWLSDGPLIMSIPASGDAGDARAYIERQPERLASGGGYSCAVA